MADVELPILGQQPPGDEPVPARTPGKRAPGEERGRYFIHTWGYQMNVHDSERMAGLLESIGFDAASSETDADLVLLNTCTVRENAAAKVAGKLGDLKRLKREREHLIVGVAGCFAQQEQSQLFEGAPHLDLVLGPRAIPQLAKHRGAQKHSLGPARRNQREAERRPAHLLQLELPRSERSCEKNQECVGDRLESGHRPERRVARCREKASRRDGGAR